MNNWLWLVIGPFNGASFFSTEEEARDNWTENDSLFKFRLSDWEQVA